VRRRQKVLEDTSITLDSSQAVERRQDKSVILCIIGVARQMGEKHIVFLGSHLRQIAALGGA